MTANFQQIKFVYDENRSQHYWNDSPYHPDKLLPLLEKTITEGEAIRLTLIRKEIVELDMFFVRPDFKKIKNLLLSYPKVKLYKSFYHLTQSQ